MLELPAGHFQHPDTDDASQAVIVVAKATLKIKGLVYVLADIIGPATILQDNLAEHHVPISSGNTLVLSTFTLCNRLNTIFAQLQMLADIGISKQAHLTHLAALHTAWQNIRRATTKHRVHLAVTQQTINRIEQQAQTPSVFFKCRQYFSHATYPTLP